MSNKKMVIVGDELLTSAVIHDAIAQRISDDWQIVQLNFGPRDLAGLDTELGKMEAQGADAVQAPAELLEEIRDAEVVLTHMCPINTRVFESAEKLELVGVLRGGTENVDTKAASDRGIPVFNALGRTSEAVSDFTVGMMLAELRNIARSHHRVASGAWEKVYPNTGAIPEMKDLTVGLVGFGEIGSLVLKKLDGFGCTVQLFDPYLPAERVPEGAARVERIEDLLQNSDVVSLHARHDIGAPPILTGELIGQMKPGSYLVNTARAGLVDMEALAEALASGRLAGAALDVFEEEPLPDNSRFRQLKNVTLTSHIAFDTAAFYTKSPVLWIDGVRSYVRDGVARSFVNRSEVDGSGIAELGLA